MTALSSLRPGEEIVPFGAPRSETPLATKFRSTWLASSIRALRERKLIDRYLAALPRDHHESMVGSVAGVWLPISVAMQHYAACDSLGLTVDEQVAIGRNVAIFAHRTSYSHALRVAKSEDVSPWMVFNLQQRLWSQVWRGGDVATFKLGAKEARVEIIAWPCSAITYVRKAMQGVLLAQTELFCTKAYVNDIESLCTSTTLGYRVAWT